MAHGFQVCEMRLARYLIAHTKLKSVPSLHLWFSLQKPG